MVEPKPPIRPDLEKGMQESDKRMDKAIGRLMMVSEYGPETEPKNADKPKRN